MDIDPARQQLQVPRLAVLGPGDVLAADVDLHILRHVVDFGINTVGGVARRVDLRALPQECDHLGEPVLLGALEPHEIRNEPVAQAEGRERQRPAGVLLFGPAEQVRAVPDLGLHFLLAVAEVVVGENGHHHAVHVTRGDLEWPTLVVKLLLVGPAHARGALCLGGVACVREADVLLLQSREMRRQNHAAAVAGPAVHVERGIVGWEIGISGIAEDAFHKIEVRDQPAGDEIPDLRAFSGEIPGTAGQTSGLSNSETMVSTGSGQLAVNGRRMSSAGGRSASSSKRT